MRSSKSNNPPGLSVLYSVLFLSIVPLLLEFTYLHLLKRLHKPLYLVLCRSLRTEAPSQDVVLQSNYSCPWHNSQDEVLCSTQFSFLALSLSASNFFHTLRRLFGMRRLNPRASNAVVPILQSISNGVVPWY